MDPFSNIVERRNASGNLSRSLSSDTVTQIHVAQVPIAHAEILASPSTLIRLVAGIEGKQIQPVLVVGISDARSGAYANVDPNAFFQLVWGDNIFASVANAAAWVLTDDSKLWQFSLPMYLAVQQTATQGQVSPVTGSAGDNVGVGLDLNLLVGNPAHGPGNDFIGGNIANTLKLAVHYIKVDL